MATCPNTSHPDWKALEARVGYENAMKEYARNGNKIPTIINKSASTSYSIDGQVFNRADTMDRMDKNPELSKSILEKLKMLYPAVNIFEGGLFTEKGEWRKIPSGEVGMHRRNAFVGAVAWANDAYLETPPHEYAHEYIEMFRSHPLIQEGLRKYGEEELAIYLGKDFAKWVIDGQVNSKDHNFIKEIWRALKSFFGIQDVREMIADNFKKGKMLSNDVQPGTGIYNYQERNRVYSRPEGTADLGEQFEKSTIDAKNIDDEMAKFYLAKELTGNGVIKYEDNLEEDGFESNVAVNDSTAITYFLKLSHRLKSMDVSDKGNGTQYSNTPGLDKRVLNNFQKWTEEGTNAADLVQQILGNKPAPTDQGGPTAANYTIALRIMKRMNYVQKYKNAIVASQGKLVSKDAVVDELKKEISSAALRRAKAYDKIPYEPLRNLLKKFEKKVLRWFLHPMLTSKYLSGGSNTLLGKVFYESLNNADTERLKMIREFNDTIHIDEINDYEKWSSHNRKGLDISEYEGASMSFYVKEDSKHKREDSPNGDLQNVKLTNSEIMSIYMMLRQNQPAHGVSPPATSISNNGFFLDEVIKGRNFTPTTKLMFGEKTQSQIVEMVEANPTMMEMVSRTDQAMGQMYEHTNTTFKQESGYDLPRVPNYFPVYTGSSQPFISKEKNTINSFRSLNARLGEDVPLKIADMNKVIKHHSNNAALYASHALPIENNKKILKELKEAYSGTQEETYLDQIEGYLNRLQDPSYLSSSQGDKASTKWLNKLTGNFAVSVLAMNIPVMMKQPVSFMHAKEEIDAKYLRQAGWGAGGVVGISPKQIMKSLKYVGVKGGETLLTHEWQVDKGSDEYKAIIKDSPKLAYRLEGAVNRELGEAMVAENTEADKINIPNWVPKFGGMQISKSRLMEGIKIFDSATVMGIYKAVQLETLEKHPELGGYDSKAFQDHVAMRAEDIVNKTQPTYDLMNRTELSQSSNPMLRVITMFGSARSKLGSSMIDGTLDAIMNWTPENKMKLLKRTVNVMAMNAIAITLIDAMKEGLLNGFDDDDEFLEYMKYGTIGTSMGAFYGISDATRMAISKVDNQPWQSQLQHPIEGMFTETAYALTDIVRIGKTNEKTGEYDYTIDDGIMRGLKVMMKGTGIPITPLSYSEKAYKNSME